jgi:hypothetical protein
MSCSSSSRAHRNNNTVRASAARRYGEYASVNCAGVHGGVDGNDSAGGPVVDRRDKPNTSSSIEA